MLALAEAADAADPSDSDDGDDDGDRGATPLLVLENGSGGGFGLGATIEELAGIEAATSAVGVGPDRFGYCLDTAHLWGAGYPIDTPEGVDEVIDAFDAALGIDRLVMVHLNDSRSELGSLADRHEHVGAGRIGGAGLARMLTHPALDHVVYMLETPGMEDGYDAVNMAPGEGAGRGRADRGPAARGVRHAEREGPQRPRRPRGQRSEGHRAGEGPATAARSATRSHVPAGAGLTAPVERASRIGLQDVLCLVGILVLAVATRLPGLALRGQWDADQGNELLVLLHWVRDGQVPLLGPSTFAGTFHHGALYYYLLAPAAFLTDVDPHAIVLDDHAARARDGRGDLGARLAVGGRWTGHVAGVLAAASPALVLGSTFIWNPNPVPLGAALALLGAVLAWTRYSARWWLLAAVGCMVAMQLHVSGGLLVPPLLARVGPGPRAAADRGARHRSCSRASVAAAIVAAGYLPLLVHELETGFTETQGLVGYLRGGMGAGAGGDLGRGCSSSAFRSLAWPFTGVITEAPMASAAVTVIVILLLGVALRGGGNRARPGLLLFTGTLLWSLPALALTAPTLLSAVPGLPNDHYHTYLDPLVLVVAATGIAAAAGYVGRFVDPRASGGRRESRLVRARARARGARRARRGVGLALAPGRGRGRRVAARRRGGRAAHRGPGRRRR